MKALLARGFPSLSSQHGAFLLSVPTLGLLGWTRSGHERVQSGPRPLQRVGKQVAVGAVDLLDARAHEAGELEQRDASGDREGGEVANANGKSCLRPTSRR
jgi:hypothetical protein